MPNWPLARLIRCKGVADQLPLYAAIPVRSDRIWRRIGLAVCGRWTRLDLSWVAAGPGQSSGRLGTGSYLILLFFHVDIHCSGTIATIFFPSRFDFEAPVISQKLWDAIVFFIMWLVSQVFTMMSDFSRFSRVKYLEGKQKKSKMGFLDVIADFDDWNLFAWIRNNSCNFQIKPWCSICAEKLKILLNGPVLFRCMPRFCLFIVRLYTT